ncbi:SH3 domain-containing protein [Primorskyibacter sp. 2E107]|uniref:SH3 domain-containing protein n=1 Tax=Primorskyibacter sp. 2E107 TaxID=3403458 RepID=UPI003AF91867
MRHLISLALAAIAALPLAAPVVAQDFVGFDRGSFGRVVLNRQQSAGVADMEYEMSVGQYNNESIQNYSPQSVFARMGHAVGRLDILTDSGIFPCTAFIVSDKYILTNYHCVPGILDNAQAKATRIDAVQFVAGYTQQGVEEGTRTYVVSPTPVEAHKDLDYAVLEVMGNPSADYGTLMLSDRVPEDGDPYWVIGHPMGEAQRISREKCKANRPALSGHQLLHTCDTLPGNSGSPVIDASLQQVIGLHHAGSKRDAVNFAIPMKDILGRSEVLVAALSTGSGTISDAPSGPAPTLPGMDETASAGTPDTAMCDGLYKEAKDLGQCFGFEAYLSLCEGHPYAVFAKGFVSSQCGDTGTDTASNDTAAPTYTPPEPAYTPPPAPTHLRPWCSSSNLNGTERTICNDAYLAGLDEEMTRAYGAQNHTSASAQSGWRTGTRDACGSDGACIGRVTLERIAWLRGSGASQSGGGSGYSIRRGNYTLSSTQCYIITASRTSVSDAQAFIRQWFPSNGNARIFQATNGYYAVAYETVARSRSDARLAQLKSQGAIPGDSYCSLGNRYTAEVVRSGASAPAPSGRTMYVDNNSDMSLNVRSGPGTNNSILTEVPSGAAVQVVGTSGQWSHITTPSGTLGWVYSPLLTSNRPAARKTCSGWVVGLSPISQYNRSTGAGYLSIRSEPSTRSGKKLSELYLGDRVTVLAQNGNWAQVRCASGQCSNPYQGIGGATGWAAKKYLNIQCN